MKPSCTARYFDGKSSKAHEVELFLDEKYLEIIHPSINERWRFADIFIEKNGKKHRLYLQKEHISDFGEEEDADPAYILLSNAIFAHKLKKKEGIQTNRGIYEMIAEAGIPSIALLLCVIIGILLSINFYIMPTIAEKAVILIPESYEKSLGAGVFNEYVRFSEVDSVRTELVREFASEIDFQNTKELQFTVIDSYEINAFALPDGNIVIYSGILEEMESYTELAALMGHEAAHVNERHSMKMMCKSFANYFLISLLMSDANAIMGVLAENAAELQSLSFSRDYEREADNEGFAILEKNHIDPQGMTQLFERLQSAHGEAGDFIPEFLSSHPLTDERIENAEKAIQEISKRRKESPKHAKFEYLFSEIKCDEF